MCIRDRRRRVHDLHRQQPQGPGSLGHHRAELRVDDVHLVDAGLALGEELGDDAVADLLRRLEAGVVRGLLPAVRVRPVPEPVEGDRLAPDAERDLSLINI